MGTEELECHIEDTMCFRSAYGSWVTGNGGVVTRTLDCGVFGWVAEVSRDDGGNDEGIWTEVIGVEGNTSACFLRASRYF